jgi:co-chaperonin GroES (HSP10)
MTMKSNNVRISVPRGRQKVTLPNGRDMFIDISFDPQKFVATSGIVMDIPDMLMPDRFPDGSHNPRGMEWDTEIEIQVGDKAFYQKYEALVALGRLANPSMATWEETASYRVVGDEIHIFIPYHSLYCVEREGELIMCNGYVLVEPVEQEIDLGLMKIPEMLKKNELHVGKVYCTGSYNKEYYRMKYMDTIGYGPGDIVLFRKYNNVAHSDVVTGKDLYKIQRRQIVAIIN